jgi:hypothetical protein
MIITRAFSPTDIPAVTRIVKESLGEQYPPSLYLTVHNLWREGFMVAVEDGEIVGFLAAVRRASGGSPWAVSSCRCCTRTLLRGAWIQSF